MKIFALAQRYWAIYSPRMRTIEIQTQQNVAIECELASLKERILAFFIDLLALLVVYIILVFAFLTTATGRAVLEYGFGGSLIFFFFPLAMFMAYHILQERFSNGQTLGKKAMGIRVARLDGWQPSFQDCLLRALFHLIETIGCIGILSTLIVGATTLQQRMGDLAAHTVVIRLRNRLIFNLEDILGISSPEDYTPEFPQVVRLSEEDMLTVKNVLARYEQFSNRAHLQVLEALGDRLAVLLDIRDRPSDPRVFLKQLLRDFVVLTR